MIMFIGYEEAKNLQRERVERSLHRYQLITALSVGHPAVPSAEAEVVELPHAEACECAEQIGA